MVRPRISISAAIPPGAQAPVNPSPSARSPYSPGAPPGQDYDPDYGPLPNPYDSYYDAAETPVARSRSMSNLSYSQSNNQYYQSTGPSGIATAPAFPEPQIYRATSSTLVTPANGRLPHRYSKSDLSGMNGSRNGAPGPLRLHNHPSAISLNSMNSFDYADDNFSTESYEEELSTELGHISLESEAGITRFQANKLPDKDEEWHRLVPPEAIQALGDKEVQRQSVIFELFKAERDYVADLETIKDVYITSLRSANPPIISPQLLPGFIAEVFGNLDQILAHHQRMLAALFARQRDQHPLIQSIADIVLDTVLKSDFRSGYETYIKHYPLSESHHRNQLRRNPAYQNFVQSVSNDPRIRKRDLITFLSRPVTRLPRLNLLLSQILKLTDHEHPDLETLPIILEVLSSCIKSTQPGIEAAESKVKFWEMCESLVYQKGEIMDLDLYDESRTLVYSGTLYRRTRQDSGWSGVTELFAGLLDNYLILTREEKRPNGAIKRYLVSRPLPLSFLSLGPFNAPPETRREKAPDGVLLSGLRSQSVPIYPFTLYHAANSLARRYTLSAPSEAARRKWEDALKDALAIHKARQDGNMYFNPQPISHKFFRSGGSNGVKMTGKVTAAAIFFSQGKTFVVCGCQAGVFVGIRGSDRFRRVLPYVNPIQMATVHAHGPKTFNKFLIHHESSLLAYSLDILARVALGQADVDVLNGSMEKIAGHDVIFFRHAIIGQRALVIYATKKLLHVTPSLNVMEILDMTEVVISPKRSSSKKDKNLAPSFRPFGSSGYIPKDAYDLTSLVKTIGVCTSDGIVILNPTDLANSAVTVVPDFSGSSSSSDPPKASLKTRIEAGAKPLGLVRCNSTELLVVYDVIGCYITKHGQPSRNSGFIKWEVQAVSYTHRGVHVLLFSPQFIEVRNVMTGRLVQVIEGIDIRLLYTPTTSNADDTILVSMRGEADDDHSVFEKVVSLVETSEISALNASANAAIPTEAWDEWDM